MGEKWDLGGLSGIVDVETIKKHGYFLEVSWPATAQESSGGA